MAETVTVTKAWKSAAELAISRGKAKRQEDLKRFAAFENAQGNADEKRVELKAAIEADDPFEVELPPVEESGPVEPPPVVVPPPPVDQEPPVLARPGYWGLGQDADGAFRLLRGWCGHRPTVNTSWHQRSKQGKPNWTSWEWLQGGPDEKFDQLSGCYSANGNPQLIAAMATFGNDIERYVSITPGMLEVSGFDNDKDRAKPWRRMIPGGNQHDNWKRFGFNSGRRSAILCDRHGVPYHKLMRAFCWECTGSWYPWTAGEDHEAFTQAYRIWVDEYRRGARAHSAKAEAGLKIRFRYSGRLNFAKSQDEFRKWHPGKDHADSTAVSFHPMGNDWTKGNNWRDELEGASNAIGALRILDFAKSMGHPSGCDEWTWQMYGEGKGGSDEEGGKSIKLALDFFAEHGGHGPGQISDQSLMHSGHDKVIGHNSAAARYFKGWVGKQMARA